MRPGCGHCEEYFTILGSDCTTCPLSAGDHLCHPLVHEAFDSLSLIIDAEKRGWYAAREVEAAIECIKKVQYLVEHDKPEVDE